MPPPATGRQWRRHGCRLRNSDAEAQQRWHGSGFCRCVVLSSRAPSLLVAPLVAATLLWQLACSDGDALPCSHTAAVEPTPPGIPTLSGPDWLARSPSQTCFETDAGCLRPRVSFPSDSAAPLDDESIAFYVTRPVTDADLARSETTVGSLEAALLTDLERASASLDAALYSLDRGNVIAALLRAQARGVRVRVVTECENRNGESREAFDELEARGIDVVDDRSSFIGDDPACPEKGGTMHDKFWIVDNRVVWMGSTNMTWTGFNYNHNHAARLQAKTIVATYEQEFERMFGGVFGRNKPGSMRQAHVVAGIPLVTAFSPYGYDAAPEAQALVLEAIAAAELSIRFALFYFTDSTIGEALVRKSNLSQGLLDATGAAYSGSEHTTLCASGIDVKVENFPGKVHHKLGIFDGWADNADDNAKVILGSANWTTSGFSYNDESLLLVHSAGLAEQASLEYEALYGDRSNEGLECCTHSAEGYNENSVTCAGTPCVCADGVDNDHDGIVDIADRSCAAPLDCAP